MLRIYPVVLDLIRSLRGRLKDLERHDFDLARQCRRALSSVALNLAEGAYSRGQNRGLRYHSALGSCREVLACLEVAEALGYAPAIEPDLQARFNQIIGTLVRLVCGR
jgi:four helix bundle protein